MKTSKWYRSLPEFDRLTGSDPVHTADMTIHEVRCYFWVELPADLEAELVQRVHTVFARHQRWRKKAQRANGVDMVQAFMRHWLAALLFKYKHPLFRELPDSFKCGQPLPFPSPMHLRQLQATAVKAIRKKARVAHRSRCFVHGSELLLP